MKREFKFRAWDEENKEMWWDTGADPEEYRRLMQYTGLRDRNGKDIYEGDIVSYRISKMAGSYLAVIRFGSAQIMDNEGYSSNSVVGFYLQELEKNGSESHLDHQESYVVLGNIYENPELLVHTT